MLTRRALMASVCGLSIPRPVVGTLPELPATQKYEVVEYEIEVPVRRTITSGELKQLVLSPQMYSDAVANAKLRLSNGRITTHIWRPNREVINALCENGPRRLPGGMFADCWLPSDMRITDETKYYVRYCHSVALHDGDAHESLMVKKFIGWCEKHRDVGDDMWAVVSMWPYY